MNTKDRLCLANSDSLMINTKGIIMLIVLSTILITGGLTIAPVAYSAGSGDDSHGGCGDDSHGDDSHGDDCNPEPDCDCKKPTVFSVIYNGPGVEGVDVGPDAEVTVEIYKKVDHIGEKDPLLTIEGIFDGEFIIIDSNVYGKKKIHSSTVYRVIQNDAEIAIISFHTSCSQPLFIGDMHSDGPVTVTVESGVDHKGRQSIFLPVDPICNEVPSTTLEVRKVLSPEDDLGTFILQIDGVDMTAEIGNGGTTGEVDVTPGPHTVGEIAGVGTVLDEYNDTIGGDCNADGTIILEEGDNAVCTITNTVKIPATITLKKALTQDNTDEANHVGLDEFHMFVTNVDDPGNPIEITMENQEIDAGTYTLSETGPPGFNFVLVSGDSGCPSMVEDMEEFTIKEGQHLTCVIYNDDDADAAAGGGGPGVIFHFDTIQFEVASPGTTFGEDCEVTSYVRPCVIVQSENSFVVRPDLSSAPQSFTKSTLVMFTMVPENLSDASGCTLQGLTFNSTLSEIDGFSLQCTSTGLGKQYNINFALVETMVP
jgi:hypothetical protein